MKTIVHSIRNFYSKLFVSYVLIFTGFAPATASVNYCANLFTKDDRVFELKRFPREEYYKQRSQITSAELLNQVKISITKTRELKFIREEAKKMGLQVWLFGGTASSFLHYAKWDFARQKKILDFQPDRFDYDFTNIFRSTQDLDIAVDGTMEQIQAL